MHITVQHTELNKPACYNGRCLSKFSMKNQYSEKIDNMTIKSITKANDAKLDFN